MSLDTGGEYTEIACILIRWFLRCLHMAIKEIPLESPIEEKIAWAENCYFQIRDQLLGELRLVW